MLAVGGVSDPAREEDDVQDGHTKINEAIDDLQRLQERLNRWRRSRPAAPQRPPRPQLKVIPPRPRRDCEDGRVKGELETVQVQSDEIDEVNEEEDAENGVEEKRDERQEELPMEFQSGQDQIQEMEMNSSREECLGEAFSMERETYLDDQEYQTYESEEGAAAQREPETHSETLKVDTCFRPAEEMFDDGDEDYDIEPQSGDDYSCPICFEIFCSGSCKIVSQCDTCRHNFCAPCLQDSLRRTLGTCPVCCVVMGTPLRNRDMETKVQTSTVRCHSCQENVSLCDLHKHEAVCNLPKPEITETKSSLGEFWECKRCTFHNEVEKKVCEMCFCSFLENGILIRGSSPTSSPKPATQRSQPDSPTKQHSPLTTRQTEPGHRMPVPAPASAPTLSVPRRESSPDGRDPGTRQNGSSSSEQTLPISTARSRESFALPVASPVSREDHLGFSNIPIPVAIPEVPTEFRGLLLLRTSSRMLFTKWKVVFVTLQGSLLMIHEPCTRAEKLNRGSAIKSFRIHPFILIEKQKYHDKVHITEKVKASSSTRISKKRDMGSVHSTRLFENPEHLVKKDANVYNSFEFSSSSKCVPYSVLVEIAAFDSRVLREFMTAVYRKVSQLRSAKLEERRARPLPHINV